MRGKNLDTLNDYSKDKKILRFDFLLFFLVIAISSFGLLIIYSATRETMPGGVSDPAYYLKRQAIYLAVGVFLCIAIQFVNYRIIKRYWWLFFATGIILLLSVLIFGFEVNGCKSWIDLKFTTIQPSEFSKIFMVISLAAVMSKWRSEKVCQVTFKKVAISLAIALSFMAFVLLEPDYGTVLIYFCVYIGMLFLSGASFLYIFLILGMAAGGVIFALNSGLIKQYQLDRILVFLKPDAQPTEGSGYSLYQSKLAIGSGGLTGKGLFLGKQTNLNYVPEHHTDFIFSVIGEELGFLGAIIVIIILGVIVWRCFYIALNSSDNFAMLLSSGIGLIILTQMTINIGMTIGIMPIIGIPLPFLSSGGSSLISILIGIGLVENVSVWREVRKEHEIAYQDLR
ncbi:MAG: rod shape-determining protein RodA [Actinomycetota bacterium]|jgi:rod shape determining protein RodA|nr:rod shape-determining protein RodA [Actinomycetota bacterium]MDD5600426.1 rod shape-determining protein RodA [Actinomycetota bacterium]